jgi:peroxiredoxin
MLMQFYEVTAMKKNFVYWTIISFIAILMITPLAIAAKLPPAAGDVMPAIDLPSPSERYERTYLGLSGSGSFTLPDINTQIVIIEIFSMYCPYCQREAPKVNDLYRKIENDQALRGKIKMIGIGAGNSGYEVDIFRKKYDVPFPLFADGDFNIYDKIGEVRTPYFLGVKIEPGGRQRVFLSKLGAFESVDQFLEQIRNLSGLK